MDLSEDRENEIGILKSKSACESLNGNVAEFKVADVAEDVFVLIGRLSFDIVAESVESYVKKRTEFESAVLTFSRAY